MVKYINSINPELFMMAIAFPCGAINEPPSLSGISHLLEHLMFRTRSNLNSSLVNNFFLRNGIKYNASTGSDYTVFYLACHEKYAFKACDFFLKLIKSLDISKSEFELEKKIVIEESFLYPNDSKKDDIFYLLFKNTPYFSSVIGMEETIKNISLKDVQKYHHMHYKKGCPHIVTITNKSKENTINNIIKKYGYNKECQHNQTIFGIDDRTMTKDNRFIYFSHSEHGTLGYLGYPASDPRKYSAMLAAFILQTEILKELREKKGNVYNVIIDYMQYMHCGCFLIEIKSNSLTIPQLLKSVKAIIKRTIKIKPEQFIFYKQSFLKYKKLTDNNQSFNQLIQLARNSLYHYNSEDFNFENITIDSFSEVCKDIFTIKKAAFKFSTRSSYRNCIDNVL